jgi:hypothetical protein
MALGAPTQVGNSAVTESLAALATTDSFAYPDSNYVWMELDNPTAGSITVTLESEAPIQDGVQELDKAVAVAAGARVRFRVSESFVDASGDVNITATATGINAGVFYH